MEVLSLDFQHQNDLPEQGSPFGGLDYKTPGRVRQLASDVSKPITWQHTNPRLAPWRRSNPFVMVSLVAAALTLLRGSTAWPPDLQQLPGLQSTGYRNPGGQRPESHG